MKLNELNLTNVLGDYGAAAVKQVGNRIAGNAEGNLSVQDKIAKEKFISNFIGRASTNLNSAIQSGLVDPNIKAGAPTAEEPPQGDGQQPPAGKAGPAPGADPGQTNILANPKTPGEPAPTGGTAGPTTPSAPVAPGGAKTPEQIRKEKQAAAGQVAQQQMAANPAPTKPGAPAAPAQQAKMTPQQTAALKGRLKAGAGATAGQSGFKNYVGGSGERMTGVDASKAPIFKKIQRESIYSKLDYILESIINIDEAEQAQSISEYLQNMFNQYLKVPITDPKAKAQIKTLADQAQASYPKMTNALTQMANLGFAMSYSQGTGATQGATTTQPQSALSSFASGFKQGVGGTAVPPEVAALDAKAAGQDQELDSLYGKKSELQNKQLELINKMIGTLTKDEKQKLLTSLTKPETSTAPEAPTTDAGAGAFDQMKNQLQEPKTTANPVNRQQKLNTNKVKAGNKGLPDPDEQAKFDQRVQQALAKQA